MLTVLFLFHQAVIGVRPAIVAICGVYQTIERITYKGQKRDYLRAIKSDSVSDRNVTKFRVPRCCRSSEDNDDHGFLSEKNESSRSRA